MCGFAPSCVCRYALSLLCVCVGQDILLTRNEYIRCELGRLQAQLQNMERRAVEIETDVRHAMSTG